MERLKGITVSDGIARGVAVIVGSVDREVPEVQVSRGQVPRELARFDAAVVAVAAEIETLKEATRAALGDVSEIINTYLAFLGDEISILRPIRRLISEDRSEAASAVVRHFRALTDELRGLPEPLPSRIPDLLDIQRRLVERLQGVAALTLANKLPKNSVIIADDLTPTQAASLDRSRVVGFATAHGGPASHTAILARHLGIPALVGLGSALGTVTAGATVIVDGFFGDLVVAPDAATLRNAQSRMRRLQQKAHGEVGEACTRDGTQIELHGNIDSDLGARELKSLGVSGIGLHRTEYLFLGREHAPSEDMQLQHYARLLRSMAPRPVVIRTMDFGSDKWDPRIQAGREPNPALGLRSLRLSFAYGDIFKTQLRALLRAGVHGNAKVLFPMVTDVEEFGRARAALRDAMEELRREGLPFREDLPVGAMLELPATALLADSLFAEADFVSIGSNDLIQYALAVDRTNPEVAALFVPHHPGVLRLMQLAVQAARTARKSITVCGEVAGMSRYTPLLIGLGFTSLSMAPSRLRDIAEATRACNVPACRELAEAMLAAPGPLAADKLLDAFHGERPKRATRRG
ncbi:MAG: phosphoenolpyruvate--protein phosphotransferase [Planctomycetes bacterium]|nr:phosphoenolpyruvate--protein phosphotransferase [Planctomycetota bacterium]